MPTVSVGRDRLFDALGRTYTEEEFDELCFEFGIELDDVTTEQAIVRKEKHLKEEAKVDEEVIYKIEVPANRYDLLCLEGLSRALRVFLGLEKLPDFKLVENPEGPLTITVAPETLLVRPYVVCAVLRAVQFNEQRYNSFIDLQDRLHQNLCRKRSIVAIGTHDLDTIEGPFSYEALPPKDIKFVPLKQTREFDGAELMEFYKSDNKLKKFLPIINDSPVFPVILDSKRRVLSLPPIINGAHSALSASTRNVLVECTGTDLEKAHTVLNTLVCMFSQYSEQPCTVEPVRVLSWDHKGELTPCLSPRTLLTDLHYVNSRVGVDLQGDQIASLLTRMQLTSTLLPLEKGENGETLPQKIQVHVPPTRSDVLHPCDVMEDVAIAYGFNKIERTRPKASTQGRQNSLNHFSDLIRNEVAQAGFTEVLTWALISHAENFKMVKKKDDGTTAVIIGNPRSADFEVVRTSLLPGMLKTVGHNKKVQRPIKLFELSDVVLLSPENEVGAKNQRRLLALFSDENSGFEIIHGLVDRVMEVNGIPLVESGNEGYFITPSNSDQYFPGRQAEIICKGKSIGIFGIVHPEILAEFDIQDPCSAVELEIEPLLSVT